MNSSAVKLIAVIVVAVAVIAAVVLLFNNNGSSDNGGTKYNINGMLPVYGNANENYEIDDGDLDIINKIIKKEAGYTLTNYPYADANYDGTVNSKDTEIVKKVINKEKTRVWIINTNFDSTTYVDYVDWPVKAALSAGVSTLPALYKCSGVLGYIKGMALSDPYNEDPYLYPELQKFESLGPNMREFNVDKVRNAIAENKDISAIVCVASLKENESIFKDNMGLSIIRPACASPTVGGYTSAMLLMGFIFDAPTQSLQVSEWFQKVKDTIDEKTKNSAVQKAIAISSNGGVWAASSDYARNIIVADGAFPDKIKNTTSTTAFGDWIYEMKDCDAIIDFHSSNSDNSWFKPDCDVSVYSQVMLKYKDTTMYQNKRCYVVAFDLPMPVKIAYAAAALYPSETGGEAWAQGLAQEFYDKFFSSNKFDASKLNVFLTTDEITSLAKS